MPVEIERKFLVDHKLWGAVEKPAGKAINQSYLLIDEKKVIRVRTKGEKAFLTIKGKVDSLTRDEYEYEIPSDEALEMINKYGSNSIIKTRFEIDVKGKTWEVDEFHELNKGLIVAEIELTSEEEKFDLPEWVKEEVSGDHRYFNSYLSENPFTTW